jgi:hypothetical protein
VASPENRYVGPIKLLVVGSEGNFFEIHLDRCAVGNLENQMASFNRFEDSPPRYTAVIEYDNVVVLIRGRLSPTQATETRDQDCCSNRVR